MTTARSQLIAPGTGGTFHCVQRCVRRAFLCGQDRYTGQSFEHRKAWVEQRIALLSDCFAVAIHAYAVMSNHLHLVLQLDPTQSASWSDAEVATRWVRLFPPREDTKVARDVKRDRLMQQPDYVAVLRERLSNLSWLMKCLAEPLARAANAEDACKGRFWEGRFKVQVLCDERALLAAMAYVDLNPVRAGMAETLAVSDHTSIRHRLATLTPAGLDRPLRPVLGQATARTPHPAGPQPARGCGPGGMDWPAAAARQAQHGARWFTLTMRIAGPCVSRRWARATGGWWAMRRT